MNNFKRILIVLIAGIGDVVLASKSLRAIRAGYPDADIHLLTSTNAAHIAKRYAFLNKIWEFPIREIRRNKFYLLQVWKLIMDLRKIEFSSIINLYMVGSFWGAFKMGLLFLSLRGKNKIGHGAKGLSLFLTKKIPSEVFQNHHRADEMMSIAMESGGIPDGNDIQIYWDKESEIKWNKLFLRKDPPQLIIGVNAGGDRENRRWDPKRYAAVADKLIEKFYASIVLLGGPGEEDIALAVERNMKGKSVNLAGKLSLDELTYIISRLDLLVTNDSGPMHIGAATKTPLVALFGPETPLHTGPYTSADLYRVVEKPLHCRPCNKDVCERPLCLDLITPEEVFAECVTLISSMNKKFRIS